MKCPRCGFFTPAPKSQCSKCGFRLLRNNKSEEQEDPQPSTVPEWRKEVSEKARAYGERKKRLNTPPRPLKEAPAETPARAEAELPVTADDLGISIDPHRPDQEPLVILQNPEPDSSVDPPPRFIPQEWLDDSEDQSQTTEKPLLLGRRAAAFLVDHVVLIVLNVLLFYVCSLMIHYEPLTLIQTAWLPLGGLFLSFHFIYYAYFYKTSRQTPGQLFFGLELRDPGSSNISFWKIVVRWTSMVFLNVLNFIPLGMKDGQLLLDQLSNTEIRSMN